MSVDLPSTDTAKLETASTSLVNSDRKRPSMFHSKQFIEYGDIVILFQVSITSQCELDGLLRLLMFASPCSCSADWAYLTKRRRLEITCWPSP